MLSPNIRIMWERFRVLGKWVRKGRIVDLFEQSYRIKTIRNNKYVTILPSIVDHRSYFSRLSLADAERKGDVS